MRGFLSVLVGVAVTVGVVVLAEAIGHALFPVPAPDTADPTAMRRYVADLPAGAKLAVATGWFVGPLVGASTALGVSRWRPAAWIVGLVAVLGGVANLILLPHPLWMQAAALLLPLLAVATVQRLVTAAQA